MHPAMKSPTMARKPTLPVCRGCGRLSALTAISSRETIALYQSGFGRLPWSALQPCCVLRIVGSLETWKLPLCGAMRRVGCSPSRGRTPCRVFRMGFSRASSETRKGRCVPLFFSVNETGDVEKIGEIKRFHGMDGSRWFG